MSKCISFIASRQYWNTKSRQLTLNILILNEQLFALDTVMHSM